MTSISTTKLPPSTPNRGFSIPTTSTYPPLNQIPSTLGDLQITPKATSIKQTISPSRVALPSPDDFLARHTREFAHLHLEELFESNDVLAAGKLGKGKRLSGLGIELDRIGKGSSTKDAVAARLADEEAALQEARRIGREKRRSLNLNMAGFPVPQLKETLHQSPTVSSPATDSGSRLSSSTRVVCGVRPLSLSMKGGVRRGRESISYLPNKNISPTCDVGTINETWLDSDQKEILRSRTPTVSSIVDSELDWRIPSPPPRLTPRSLDCRTSSEYGHSRGISNNINHSASSPWSQRKRNSVAFSTYSWATGFSGETDELKSAAHYAVPRDEEEDMSTPEKIEARRRQVKTIAQTVRVLEGVSSSRPSPLEAATRAQIAASYRSNFDSLEVEVEVEESPDLAIGSFDMGGVSDYGSPPLRTPETPAIPSMPDNDHKQLFTAYGSTLPLPSRAKIDHIGQPLAPPPLFENCSLGQPRPDSATSSSTASGESEEFVAQGARLMADRPWMRSGGSNAAGGSTWGLRALINGSNRVDERVDDPSSSGSSRPSFNRTQTDRSDSTPFEYDDSSILGSPLGLGLGSNVSSFTGVSAWWRGPTDGMEASRSSRSGLGGEIDGHESGGVLLSSRRGGRQGYNQQLGSMGVAETGSRGDDGLGFRYGEDGARGRLEEPATTTLMMGSSRSSGAESVEQLEYQQQEQNHHQQQQQQQQQQQKVVVESSQSIHLQAPDLNTQNPNLNSVAMETPKLKPFKLRARNMERNLSESSDIDLNGGGADSVSMGRNNCRGSTSMRKGRRTEGVDNSNNNDHSLDLNYDNRRRQSVSPRSLHYRRALSSSPSPNTSHLPYYNSNQHPSPNSPSHHTHPHPHLLYPHAAHKGESEEMAHQNHLEEVAVEVVVPETSVVDLDSSRSLETSSVLSMTQALAMDPIPPPPLPPLHLIDEVDPIPRTMRSSTIRNFKETETGRRLSMGATTSSLPTLRPISLSLPSTSQRWSLAAVAGAGTMTRSHTMTGLERESMGLTLTNQFRSLILPPLRIEDHSVHSSSLGLSQVGLPPPLPMSVPNDHPAYPAYAAAAAYAQAQAQAQAQGHGSANGTRPSVIPLSNLLPARPKRRSAKNSSYLTSALSHFHAPPLPSPSVLFFLGFLCPLTWPIGGWVATSQQSKQPLFRTSGDIEMAIHSAPSQGQPTTTTSKTKFSHPDVWVTRCRYAAAVAYSVLIPGLVTGVVVAAVH